MIARAVLLLAALVTAGCVSPKKDADPASQTIKSSERTRSDVHWMMRDMEDRIERQFSPR